MQTPALHAGTGCGKPNAAACLAAAFGIHLCAAGIIAVAPGFGRTAPPDEIAVVALVSMPEPEPVNPAPAPPQKTERRLPPAAPDVPPAHQPAAVPTEPERPVAERQPDPPAESIAHAREEPRDSPRQPESTSGQHIVPAEPARVENSPDGGTPSGLAVLLPSGEAGGDPRGDVQTQPAKAGGSTPSLQNRDSYFSLVRSLLERHKIYPDAARRRGETGSVTVRFTISPSGALADIGVERSSGRKALDEAALLTVRRASPLPSPPVNDGQGLPVRVTITFHLTG